LDLLIEGHPIRSEKLYKGKVPGLAIWPFPGLYRWDWTLKGQEVVKWPEEALDILLLIKSRGLDRCGA
jgi:hypothetical protein